MPQRAVVASCCVLACALMGLNYFFTTTNHTFPFLIGFVVATIFSVISLLQLFRALVALRS
jgi:uncharacterized membrane protein (DUF373 family)